MAFRLNAARRESRAELFSKVRSLAFSAAARAASKQPVPEGRLKTHLEQRRRRRAGALSSSRSARLRSCGRNFSQRNSIKSRMTPSLVGLSDNRCKRSSSASADLIGRNRRGIGPGRWQGEAGRSRSESLYQPRQCPAPARPSARRGVIGRSQFVELRARRLRVRSVRMGGQERAPSFGRLRPLGNSIVQVLVDIRRGDWIDRRNLGFRLCVGQGLADA